MLSYTFYTAAKQTSTVLPEGFMDQKEHLTAERKHHHVEICLHDDVGFSGKTTGFEHIELEHNAVPEINFNDIDLSTTFLGRRIGYPFMISSMTGGYSAAAGLNRSIAETAEKLKIPLGVGSMRQALENDNFKKSFSIVRDAAPSIPVLANIGAPEVAGGLSHHEIASLIDMVSADALIVHLNPAQELFQPEGNTNFSNFLRKLEELCSTIPMPVIAKEVGCGIAAETAKKLIDAGVSVIDVAGAGGLSWQKVEEVRYTRQFGQDRRFSPSALETLLDWGIPTARCLTDIAGMKKLEPRYEPVTVIASGGISNGIDIAKAIALGAGLAASAGLMLKALHDNVLEQTILTWMNDLKAAMFLTGSKTVGDLQQTRIFIHHG